MLVDIEHGSTISLSVERAGRVHYLSCTRCPFDYGSRSPNFAVVRTWCSTWEEFIVFKHRDGRTSLQDAGGNFLSPLGPDEGQEERGPHSWIYRQNCDEWEKFHVEVNEHDINGLVSKAIVIKSVLGNLTHPTFDQNHHACRLSTHSNKEDTWRITLRKLPVLSMHAFPFSRLTELFRVESYQALESQEQEFVRKILRAHVDVGAFFITGHGLPIELFDTLRTSTAKQPGRNDIDAADNEFKSNILLAEFRNMQMSVIDDFHSSNSSVIAAAPVPAEALKRMTTQYFNHAKVICEGLLHLLALGQAQFFQTPPEWRCIFADNHCYLGLRFLTYPPGPARRIDNGNEVVTTARHTDATWITLLIGDDVGGLQMLKDDSWIHVAPVGGGEALVNTGNVLMRESNGTFPAVCHRVVRTEMASSKTRHCMPFFYDRQGENTGGC
jgi:isopenicillin N synthase-like dioxygenase